MNKIEQRRTLCKEFINKTINNKSYDAKMDLAKLITITKEIRLDRARDRVEI